MVYKCFIYACNMKENALAYVFYMHGHIASSRVWVHGLVYSSVLVNGS